MLFRAEVTDMKKISFAFLLLSLFLWASAAPAEETAARYEYKIISLGSFSGLQNAARASDRIGEIESLLNREGLQGWDIVEVLAVRTTSDPNVFFAVMKRPLP